MHRQPKELKEIDARMLRAVLVTAAARIKSVGRPYQLINLPILFGIWVFARPYQSPCCWARDERVRPGLSVARAAPVSVVTGAFLAAQREMLLAHGGFDKINLPVAYSGIDYALKLRRGGAQILWTPQTPEDGLSDARNGWSRGGNGNPPSGS